MADKKLKVTLVRSTIGAVPKNKKIIESMGLRKVGKTVEIPDNDASRGQIRLVAPYLKVEEV
ncbi:MAG: 50S ribosomal protein L30 [Lachnospiraceae bacterium]|nr:50S ribosomal protein L30 [Lachnospiraceae bacterium]